jgi:hypothetical protein
LKKATLLFFAALLAGAGSSSAADTRERGAGADAAAFALDLEFGVREFFEPDEKAAWQRVGLGHEFEMGSFFLAFDAGLNVRFDGGPREDRAKIRTKDWYFKNPGEFRDVYFPKVRSLRLGGEDTPVFLSFGDIEGATLGNGFIMSSYTNTLFEPENPVLGMYFTLDGKAVELPFFRIESYAANAARFDVFAMRIHFTPFTFLKENFLKKLTLGTCAAVDREPAYYALRYDEFDSALLPNTALAAAHIYGVDFSLPLNVLPFWLLTLHGDWATTRRKNSGGMGGVDNRFFGFLDVGLELGILGENFMARYFGASYDLYRLEQYAVYNAQTVLKEKTGAYGFSLGISLFEEKLSLWASSRGPTGSPEGGSREWQAGLSFKEVFIPRFFFDILYEKKNMKTLNNFTNWKNDSLLKARLTYRANSASLALVYTARHFPSRSGHSRQTLLGIESRIKLKARGGAQ